jgi:geranylgeranyl diphosphate synthase type II
MIESALDRASQFGAGCPENLSDAIRYALLAPGKRLRPALVLMAAEACGGSLEAAMPGAVAVEMIHAYSLIHDDLPAMDDDDLRRGRPTVHVAFDEATAILAGDALLAEAFSHLANNIPEPELAAEAVRVLAIAAGPTQLVGGQADDLAAESAWEASNDSEPPSSPARVTPLSNLDLLESIHRRKTGALFAASLDLGAVLAGGDRDQRQILGNYARDIGLAFQVVDDLLDLTADSASLGKRAGKDANRGKLTYPGLLGVERARTRAEQLVASARGQISVFDSAAWRLTELADYVLERTH